MMARRLFLKITLLIFTLIVVGCESSTSPSQSTSLPTRIGITSTLPSPSPSATPTPMPKPTHPPIPTMLYDLQDQLYLLLANNGNCELPCFLGITPGKTTWAEAKLLLEAYSINKPIKYDKSNATATNKQYTASIHTTKDIGLDIKIKLDVNEKDIVTHIDFNVTAYHGGSLAFDDRHLSRYSLREVFRRHGKPDAVYLLPPERAVYAIHIVYEKLKLVIGLTGRAKELSGGGYELCPNLGDGDIPTMEIALASPADTIDVKTLIGFPFWEDLPPFEETSGMNINEFYQLMIGDQQPACFQVK